jgi:predicted regulator of Ras-like GTPase activity (Roadblock/LC7/MglB family)
VENTLSDLRSATALFDNADKAERAIAWLLNIGVVESQIRQATLGSEGPAAPEPAAAAPKKRRSFMDSLVDLVLPDDKPKLGKGLKGSGPRTVTVSNIAPGLYDTIVKVLSDEGQLRAEEAPAAEPEPQPVPVMADAAPAWTLDIEESALVPIETVEAVEVDHRGPVVAVPRSTTMTDANAIRGLIGACLVDSRSGEMLASEGPGSHDVDRVAKLNADFMRTWDYSVEELRVEEPLDEILMTLETQVHLVRPLEKHPKVFLYVALDKAVCNLGLARLQLKQLEAGLAI